MAIDGVSRNINLIGKLNRFTVLVASNYTRGTLYTSGADLKILGQHNTTSIGRKPANSYTDKSGNTAYVGYDLSFSTTLLTKITDDELIEYDNQIVTLFLVDPVRLKRLDGYTDSETDFTNINGSLSAIILDNVKIGISTQGSSGELTKVNLTVNKSISSLVDGVYTNEAVGTYRNYWSWQDDMSLTDTVGGLTLTNNGAGNGGTHYQFDGVSDYMHGGTGLLPLANNYFFYIKVDSNVSSSTEAPLSIVFNTSGLKQDNNVSLQIQNSTARLRIRANGGSINETSFTIDSSSDRIMSVFIDFDNYQVTFVDITGSTFQKSRFTGIQPQAPEGDFYIGRDNYSSGWTYWAGDIYQIGVSY